MLGGGAVVNEGFLEVHLNMGKESQRNTDFGCFLAFNLLFNWNVDILNGRLVEVLLIGKSKSAALFPRPESVVENFNLFILG